jgi:hypothetical protein
MLAGSVVMWESGMFGRDMSQAEYSNYNIFIIEGL